jgi:hypothetical protein
MERCNATLELGDDYGDNSSTMKCGLEINHEGPHKEEFSRKNTPVVVTWFVDDRFELCDICKESSMTSLWPEHCSKCYFSGCSSLCLEQHPCDSEY